MNDFSTEIAGTNPSINRDFNNESVSLENWTVLSLIERPLYAVLERMSSSICYFQLICQNNTYSIGKGF